MSTRDQQLNSIWERSKVREDECLSARKILEVSTQQIAERMVAELPFPTLAYTLERRSCLMNTISPLVQIIGKSLSLSCFEFEACNIMFRVSLIPRAEGVRAWEKHISNTVPHETNYTNMWGYRKLKLLSHAHILPTKLLLHLISTPCTHTQTEILQQKCFSTVVSRKYPSPLLQS